MFIFKFNLLATRRTYRFEFFLMFLFKVKSSIFMEKFGGHVDEFVTLSWDFKLNSGFLPPYSFCHIFQLKAVDGDDSLPLIRLTPQKSTQKELQLLHYDSKQELYFLKAVSLQVIS